MPGFELYMHYKMSKILFFFILIHVFSLIMSETEVLRERNLVQGEIQCCPTSVEMLVSDGKRERVKRCFIVKIKV